MQLHNIPIFDQLKDCQNILIAGAGGGFDIFSGIPILINLLNQGKQITLANFSFTWLDETTSEKVFPYCYKIQTKDQELSGRKYFPEKYLKVWLEIQGIQCDVYGFERTGVNPLKEAYKYLIKQHQLDAVILVDGGTDSLMFGDEEGLGTPQEDVCSMAAVYRSGIKKQFLMSIGFGIDHYHGVSHYRFLENIAQMAREGGYLGAFQLIKEMEEAQKYIDAVRFSNERMPGMESIVSNSIVSALEGHYGDHHSTQRTRGSQLWINPLMTFYWCFDLRSIIKKIHYYDWIKSVNTIGEFNLQLSEYRNQLNAFRAKKQIPI